MFNYLKFKEIRRKKKISVDDLAKAVDSTPATIYHYQSGNSQPSIEFIERLSEFLGVDYQELIKNEENDAKKANSINYQEAFEFAKAENKRLWELIHFFTKGQAIAGDLGKWVGSYLSVKQSKMISLMVTPSKQVA